MSNKIKNIIIIAQSVILLIIIIVGGIYFIPKVINKAEAFSESKQHVNIDDNISDLEFYDNENNKGTFSGKYKFIIYLSKDCSTCISHIPVIKRINETFCNGQDLELMLMWMDSLPDQETMDYYGLSDCSYYLDDIHMSDSYNTVFLADANNNILFTEKSDYTGILDKIIEFNILDEEKLILDTNKYIKENIVKNYSGKPDLIYFSMPGCPDCADANPIVYSDAITEKLHMTRIELVKGSTQYDIKDEYNIFRKIYKIDWYPSFLVIKNDGDWGIVRKVELTDMQDEILAILK